MAKKVEVEIDVKSNIEGSIAQLKELKKQLKQTAAGSEEFKKLYNQIDDLEDKIKSSKKASADWIDTLESAGGPIGALGAGLNKLKVATQSFGGALKAAGIGLAVTAVAGLVAAFSQTEGSMKKLEPLMIAFQKILGGIFEALTPLIDSFVELATKALPYITTGIKVFYSSLVALFTLVKEGGVGIGKILKGIFTLDKKAIDEGFNQLKGSWSKTVEAFDATSVRFEEGYKKRTKIEKENAKNLKELADKALAEKLKRMEAEDKLDEAKLEKLKQEALALADTEQKKLDVEKAFADKSYQLKKKELEDKQSLYSKDSVEYKTLQAEIITLDADNIAKKSEFVDKQKKINEDTLKEQKDFNKKVSDIQVAAISDETKRAIAAREQKKTEDLAALEVDKEFIKLSEEEKERIRKDVIVAATNDIAKIKEDARKKDNEIELKKLDDDIRLIAFRNESLLTGTKAYFEGRRALLDAEEARELAKLDITEAEKTAIKQKYGKLRKQVDEDEIASYGRVVSASLDALANLSGALASSMDDEAKTSKKAFEERKKLQKATAIMSAASGIVQILTQPSTLPSPFDWIVKGINAAALGISTAVQIKNIDKMKFEGGGSATVSMPPPSYTGTPAGMATPQIQAGGGTNPTSQIASTLAAASGKPIRAYVVSGDVSSQQALDRKTNRGATFGGG